jgi:hypothetical protein
MTPENENAYTPEAEDEGNFPVHPFTEDEPVTTGRSTDETLPSEGDGPLRPAADARPVADEPVRTEADEPFGSETAEPFGSEADEPVRAETYEPVRAERDEAVRAERDEAVRAERDEAVRAERDEPAGVAGGQQPSLTELGPLFDGGQASEFQQRWKEIQSGFVEDPENAVRSAESLTDSILTSLTRSLEDRRQILDRSARDGDTEQLRLVLRQYREVLEGVTSL